MLWLPFSTAERPIPVTAQCPCVARGTQVNPLHPSGPALTQLSMQSQLKATPAHSVWAVDNMHVAFMHACFLAVSETRLINTSSNWYSTSFSVIQTFHQRPLTYNADTSTQARQATYQKPFENKEPNLDLFANSERVIAVILYLQYFANSETLIR